MTGIEKLWGAVQSWWWHLVGLGPLALAINAGLTVVVVVAAVLIQRLSRWLMCQGLSRLPHESAVERNMRARKALQFTGWVVGLLVTGIAAVFIADLWGFDVMAWASQGNGQKITSTFMRLLTVIVITAVALEAISLFARSTVQRLKSQSHDPRRAAQLDTLGPIVRRVLQVIIIVLAMMTVLSQIGVQIAPILSAAGVVGIAVGFGAQSLVKDFFTGLFLLVEDIVAIGDVVQIQSFSGEVEDMTLRTIRLRDADGTLHIFPYGESQIIHNMTKTFSFAAMDLVVKPETDLDKAMEVMRTTAAELRKDPDYGPLIDDDIEIAGIDLLSDVGIVIKGRIRTIPNERWKVLRAYNLRIKHAFDAAGIGLAHK